MPRKPTILQSQFPYHIRARCINRQWFDVPTEQVWELAGNYLYFLHHAYSFRIHAFTLMDNHFHGIFSTPEANLDRGMNYFQREMSREISARSGRINQTFGGPYKWSILDSYNYYLNAYKYVYRNPVEAGLSENCEQYPFSTLNGLLGQQRLIIPVEEDTILFEPDFSPSALAWLNRGNKQDFEEVRRALKKPYFRFSKIPGKGTPVRTDNFVY
jgi:REP element-mobilizing transposase RayT